MINYIHKVRNPKFLVITPLRPGDEPYRELMEFIWRHQVEFDWISYCGPHNIPLNTQKGLQAYCKENKKPKYFIKVDNDISFRVTPALDRMYACIKDSPKNVAYVYSSFAFIGMMNMRFGADKFDPKRLLDNNYISSVSMIKTSIFEKMGGFITDDKYIRLLDWAYWLYLLRHGYIGQACPEAYFEAIVDHPGISNGPNEEFFKKKALVQDVFVKPLREKYK